jgi:hypothetical protein
MIARGIEWAYAFVHGAAGRTWRSDGESWLAEVDTRLMEGPLCAGADSIVERLRDRLCQPAVRAEATERFIFQHRDSTRLVIYGLGRNGLPLLEQLRCGDFRRPPLLACADDHVPETYFGVLEFPREDPRRWRTWPARTAVIVTPEDYRAIKHVLVRAGGLEGRDYLCLCGVAALSGAAS